MTRRIDLLRFVAGLAGLTIVVSLLWMLVWVTVIPMVRGWSPVAITSGSMTPAVSVGDVVIAQPIESDELLGPGSVIVFENPAGEGLVTHRVVAVDSNGNYITQGDANARVDSSPVPPESIRGVARVLVPAIGVPFVWSLQGRWLDLAIIVVLLAATLWAARWPFQAEHDPWRRSPPASEGALEQEGGSLGRVGHLSASPFVVVLAVVLAASGATSLGGSEAGFSDPTINVGSSFQVEEWKSVVAIDGGLGHTCLVRVEGRIWCWGLNDQGQLGDGTKTDSLAPTEVSGIGGIGTLGGVGDVGAGSKHTCASTTAGTVRCWGDNPEGQLGDGTTTDSLAPVAVVGPTGSGELADAVAVVGGLGHSCALRSDGSVWCWGRNDKGQLGDGSTTDSLVPVLVRGPGGTGSLSGVVEIAAGSKFVCAVKADGSVWCWGENSEGQLGDGTTTDSSSPVQVKGVGGVGTLSNVVDVAAGELFACGVDSVGAVVCWGRNDKGQLGDGSTTDSLVPVAVVGAGSSGVVEVAAGLKHGCVAKGDGSAWCWGDNADGQLGDGTTNDSFGPVQVVGVGGSGTLTSVTLIAAGDLHSCAALSDWTVRCWGRNDKGQLGDNTSTDSTTPVQVKGAGGSGTLTSIVEIGLGGKHSCGLNVAGGIWCWGLNDKGQLGDDTTADRPAPVRVVDETGGLLIDDALAIGAGTTHACSVRADSSVWCWGQNSDGQLGDGTKDQSSRPVQVI